MGVAFAPGEVKELNAQLYAVEPPTQYDNILKVGGGDIFTYHYWRMFKATHTKLNYHDFKELGYNDVTVRFRYGEGGIRDPDTKYIQLYGHGDSKQIVWGEYEATMYTERQARSDLKDRPAPIFSEAHMCDSLEFTGRNSWASALTKDFSPGSCVIGYKGQGTADPDWLVAFVWPAVRQFYTGILEGMSFYAAYEKAVTDYESADLCFKFAGDRSDDFKLPHRTPSFAEPSFSHVAIPHYPSLTFEFSVEILGSEWATLEYSCLSHEVWCHRQGSKIITKPGMYALTLDDLKPGLYEYTCTLSNSLYVSTKQGRVTL